MGAVVMWVCAACLTLWAAPVAAQSATITCFYILPIAPGQRPAATPLVFKRRDGYEVCMRYQYKCSLENPACLAQEAQLGVWKWHYMAASRSGCLAVAAAARATDSNIRNVRCCSNSRCNMPDKDRDPTTQIVLDSWLSRSTVRPTRASAVPAAAAPQDNTVPDVTNASPAAEPQALPTPAPLRTVTPLMAAVVPKNVATGNDGLLNAGEHTTDSESAPAVASSSNSTNASRFEGRNLDKYVGNNSSSSSSNQGTSSSDPSSSGGSGSSAEGRITCYVAYPWAPGQDVPQAPAVYSANFSTKDGYDTCAKFSYRCTAASGTCSPAEVRQGRYRISYSALSKATCASMKSSSGFFRDVTCCESMNCNKPESGTQVLQAPVLTAA